NAGMMLAVYGSASGLKTSSSQLFYQGSAPGSQHRNHEGGIFGYAVATGDFNNDGYTHVVVSSPHNRVHLSTRDIIGGGIIETYYGSAKGLTNTGNQAFSLFAAAGAEDLFGTAVATGDFNGDGYSDIAVGIPYRDDGATDAGAVKIFFGSATGIVG